MVRICKGGRARKDGERYASGDLKPQKDLGTDELRWHKDIVAGRDSLAQVKKRKFAAVDRDVKQGERDDTDISPLGMLVARGLITELQHQAAVRFLALHHQTFRDAPKLGRNGLFASTVSGPGIDDIAESEKRQARGIIEWEETRDRYNKIRAGLSLPQLETVRALVIEGEIARQDVRVFSDIVSLNITGSPAQCKSGALAPVNVQRRVDSIRNALDRLNGPRKVKWSELSESQRNAVRADN